MADIAVSASFLNFEFAGHQIDSTRWKNLSRYLERIIQEKYIQQSFQQAKERFSKI